MGLLVGAGAGLAWRMATERQGNGRTGAAADWPWLPLVWIVAASALAHLWCLGSQFYLDDAMAIRENDQVLSGRFWQNVPLSWTILGYIVQHRLFGFSPVAFHAVNWLLHTAVACVVFGFGRDFLRGRASAAGLALFGALLFAVHPLASEIPNYARTQDLAWVTLFSLLASWALLRFLRDGGWRKLLWFALAFVGATLSKGPGMGHVLMMTCTVGVAFVTAEHWRVLRRRGWWMAGVFLLGTGSLWLYMLVPNLTHAAQQWGHPRFIGHAYTLTRVFWEFAWRSVIPVSLCADHQIAETMVSPGEGWFQVTDTGAKWAAAAMLALTGISLWLAWRKSTRLVGICLFLYVMTILFRTLFVIDEFMPEYRIYPGMPWFCLGAAIVLGALWKAIPGEGSPRFPVVVLVLGLAFMSARRSFAWHDLDRLAGDILRQYPAQARALWELDDRDIAAGQWQRVIDRQRNDWGQVTARFEEENRRLGPRRELPTGKFALATIGCQGCYALAVAHLMGSAAGLAEIRRLEDYMHRLNPDPVENKALWDCFYSAKVRMLEQAGAYQAASDFIRQTGLEYFKQADIQRVEKELGQRLGTRD